MLGLSCTRARSSSSRARPTVAVLLFSHLSASPFQTQNIMVNTQCHACRISETCRASEEHQEAYKCEVTVVQNNPDTKVRRFVKDATSNVKRSTTVNTGQTCSDRSCHPDFFYNLLTSGLVFSVPRTSLGESY